MSLTARGLYRQCLRELPKAKTRYQVPFDLDLMKDTLKQRFVNHPRNLDPALAAPLLKKARIPLCIIICIIEESNHYKGAESRTFCRWEK